MGPIWMTLLLASTLGLFAWSAARRWRLMRVAAAPAQRGDRFGERLRAVLLYVFGQKRMFRYSLAGLAHAVIFFGFVILLLNSLMLWGRGYDPHFSLWVLGVDSPLGIAYGFVRDVFTVLVILGVLVFAYYRLIGRLPRLTLSAEGVVILAIIFAMMVADLVYEGGEIVRMARAGEHGGGHFYASMPFGSVAAALMSVLPDGALSFLWQLGFWTHSALVLIFLNLLPYGKHFHVITVIPNVFAQDLAGIGRLRPIADIEGRIERSETLGVARAKDLSWKAVLDLYTCTECGRCSDHCPAFNTGKLLSPKQFTIDVRDHIYLNERALVGGRGRGVEGSRGQGEEQPPVADEAAVGRASPAVAAAGTHAVPPFVGRDGKPIEGDDGQLVPHWIDPEVLWACTTCGACEQECPVFISYVDKIVDMRRHLVMEKGEFPDQLQNAFRGLESVGNPYSFANEQRADWAAGLEIPLRSEKPDAAVLYWVGCAPSFDDRARKIARATAQLMKLAGVEFAILGREEKCTGDPARRAGNEYLFQTFAQENVATLNNYSPKRIVTTCPHCFNTLRNEYRDFGGAYDVVHHTDFLLELLRAGKLRPEHHVLGTVVYHDSCYLGRYNNVYDAPRELLRAIPGLSVVEAKESRDRGMCCGAGGAQMWKEDEPIRRPGSREGDGKVNHARTRQLLRVLPHDGQPRTVASACPFCMTMLRDGLRDQGHEDVTQQDVAEILWRSVKGE